MIGKIFRVFSNDWKKISGEKGWRGKTNRSKMEQNERLECGRDVYIENHENRFADMEKREGCGWGRQLGTTRDNSFQGARPNRAATGCVGALPDGKRMERGRKMHPRQVYLLIKRFFNGTLVNISFGKSH